MKVSEIYNKVAGALFPFVIGSAGYLYTQLDDRIKDLEASKVEKEVFMEKSKALDGEFESLWFMLDYKPHKRSRAKASEIE